MHELTRLIKEDMKPAFGVTEPGAIAFATAKARSYTNGAIESIHIRLNSGMYKNAFTCGIPNSTEVGNVFAAALGAVAGNSEKGLEALAEVTPEDNDKARILIEEDRVRAEISGISSDIFIEATVKTHLDSATVTIHDAHTNITKIMVNGRTTFEKEFNEASGTEFHREKIHRIHTYKLADLYDYVSAVDITELDFIEKAFDMNMKLFEEGIRSSRSSFARNLRRMNGGMIFSDDEQKTAQLLCNGAIEARVIGLDKPAMSITGSGAHGIIASMPLYGVHMVGKTTMEKLLRGTALSYLITMYIKEYSGRLSAFCGCAIAAGTGMACGLAFMKDGNLDQIIHTINNMASSITGMICDGGNQGCTMKGIVAVDAAFRSTELAMTDSYVFEVHGINGKTPEETMRNMGLIACPGMVGTEKVIVEIFESKLK